MKTLDEVIKSFEWCCNDDNDDCDGCPYNTGEVTDCHVRNTDALHYLKMYRDKHDEMLRMEEALGYCEMADNPPLTWQELRQMEGKPVWVEGEHGCIWDQKAWSLIRLDAENDDIVICISTDGGVHYKYAIGKEDYGTDWQAYRKERDAR